MKDSNSDKLICKILTKWSKTVNTADLRPVAVGRLGCMVGLVNGGVYCFFGAPALALQQEAGHIQVCSLTGLVAMLRKKKTPGLAGLSKYWDSELTHTAVRSLTGVWQPDQSSVSLISWYAVLLWVTETSTASWIPNDGWCTEMLPLGLFHFIIFSSLLPPVLLFSRHSYIFLCSTIRTSISDTVPPPRN